MPVSFHQYRGEIGVFYNCSSKYTFVRWSCKFNIILMSLLLHIFICLAFYFVLLIKALKKCNGKECNYLFTFIDFLFSFNRTVVIFSPHSDSELNPGPKRDINQCFSVYHWNLNSVKSSNISEIQSLIAYNFDMICFSESYLNFKILSRDSNLQIPGYNFARMDHPSKTWRSVLILQICIASENHRRILF